MMLIAMMGWGRSYIRTCIRWRKAGQIEGELCEKVGLFPDNVVEMRKAALEERPPPPEIKEGVCCISYAHTHCIHSQLVVVMAGEVCLTQCIICTYCTS